MSILEQIVESKKREIERLHAQHDMRELQERVAQNHPNAPPRFYQAFAETRARGEHFFIAEFKRKSPSEGWLDHDANLPLQVRAYAQAGASAISILTDEPFFGGSYADLTLAAQTLHLLPSSTLHPPPLLLQKDFILSPIQIYLAKLHGADIILLIAAILEPERLDFLKKTAELLGMGVLVEVHDEAELAKIQHLDFPVLGVNNRDLKTFRTALNRVNVLKKQAGGRFVVAESGIRDYRDFQAVRHADGFLIGTGLMRAEKLPTRFEAHFQGRGKFLFKACGIRTPEMLTALSDGLTSSQPVTKNSPDFIGLNFSPVSRRRVDAETCEVLKTSQVSNAVAVFYKNTETDIRKTHEKYPFHAVQLYAHEVSPEFVRSLKQRVMLAMSVRETADMQQLEPFAADVDFFILDGATPGSGQRVGAAIPADFPYPFLLAGGLNEENLEVILDYENCIGADIASGIETDGQVDVGKIHRIAERLADLKEIVEKKFYLAK
ncbi:MAG: bifunctional indole-3-glycerol phosphate synthase/phosphoribosylanthranilate isomerase [Saprospiraceae bacterium]|nr:bifunctional indole-3-glycerol phosphate synthase/phosphoribosylanthranilate isomerase [Saprospiraceae bacterium]